MGWKTVECDPDVAEDKSDLPFGICGSRQSRAISLTSPAQLRVSRLFHQLLRFGNGGERTESRST